MKNRIGIFNELATKNAKEEVLYELNEEKRVATITFNREHAGNAYTTAGLILAKQLFDQASTDNRVGVVVFTSVGYKARCAGGDTKEYFENYCKFPYEYKKYIDHAFVPYIESILYNDKIVIMRENGFSVGGGWESKLACDLVVSGEHIYNKHVGSAHGSVAAGGGTQWHPIHVGDKLAREILFLNEPYNAWWLFHHGYSNVIAATVKKSDNFVTRFNNKSMYYLTQHEYDPTSLSSMIASKATSSEIKKALKNQDGYSIDLSMLDKATEDLCSKILKHFPVCEAETKRFVNHSKIQQWEYAKQHIGPMLVANYMLADGEGMEGFGAFNEKREPNIEGIWEGIQKKGLPQIIKECECKEDEK